MKCNNTHCKHCMEMDNLCSVNISVIRSILDSDDYVYFVLNGGDSNE